MTGVQTCALPIYGVEDIVELLVELLDGSSADAVSRYQLLQTGLAYADQGKFGGNEERVCCDEQHDRRNPQHDESNHEIKMLPSARS